MDREEIREFVKNNKKIPMLTDTSRKIIDLMQKNEIFPEEIIHAINTDPILAARIIGTANSPYYRNFNEVNNLKTAIIKLGINTVLNLAFSFSIQSNMHRKINGFNQEKFWKKSIIAAWLSLNLNKDLKNISSEVFYLASLLQDVGVVVLSAMIGEDYNELFNNAKNHQELFMQELQKFDIDHATVGAILAQEWGFTEDLTNAIHTSHCAYHDCSIVPEESLSRCVAMVGYEADSWLTENKEFSIRIIECTLLNSDLVDINFQASLESLPEAEAIFGYDNILSKRQIDNIQKWYSEKLCQQDKRSVL